MELHNKNALIALPRNSSSMDIIDMKMNNDNDNNNNNNNSSSSSINI